MFGLLVIASRHEASLSRSSSTFCAVNQTSLLVGELEPKTTEPRALCPHNAKVLLCENNDPTNPTKPRGTSSPNQEIVVSVLVLEQVKQE